MSLFIHCNDITWIFSPEALCSFFASECSALGHVEMLAVRDRLWFVDATSPGRITLSTWRPDGVAPQVGGSLHGD